MKKFEKIWVLALPYLKKGSMKNFVIHTRGVVKAMELLLEGEGGNKDILIPAAILHDVGWSKISSELQKSKNNRQREKAMILHLKYASPIIEEILTEVNYNRNDIKKIISIVISHKFKNPKDLDKRLLIDADNLSDAFKEQFNSDVKMYKTTPRRWYSVRKKNKFYTETAKKIFDKELGKRLRELEK